MVVPELAVEHPPSEVVGRSHDVIAGDPIRGPNDPVEAGDFVVKDAFKSASSKHTNLQDMRASGLDWELSVASGHRFICLYASGRPHTSKEAEMGTEGDVRSGWVTLPHLFGDSGTPSPDIGDRDLISRSSLAYPRRPFLYVCIVLTRSGAWDAAQIPMAQQCGERSFCRWTRTMTAGELMVPPYVANGHRRFFYARPGRLPSPTTVPRGRLPAP